MQKIHAFFDNFFMDLHFYMLKLLTLEQF